ncbi:YggS family pyridoxal phosphate-dependent enzyme, partial [Neisseria gonorrhoeae]
MTVLQERYREVSDRIGKLVLQAGREPHSVGLIAVSKTFPS